VVDRAISAPSPITILEPGTTGRDSPAGCECSFEEYSVNVSTATRCRQSFHPDPLPGFVLLQHRAARRALRALRAASWEFLVGARVLGNSRPRPTASVGIGDTTIVGSALLVPHETTGVLLFTGPSSFASGAEKCL
jgi:hypothetical protein